jgi:hypothetical protein
MSNTEIYINRYIKSNLRETINKSAFLLRRSSHSKVWKLRKLWKYSNFKLVLCKKSTHYNDSVMSIEKFFV